MAASIFSAKDSSWRARKRVNSPAVFRRQCTEDRSQARHEAFLATDHQAVAQLETPDATACSRIDVMESHFRQRFRAPHVVMEVGIASVNECIAALQQAGDGIHC